MIYYRNRKKLFWSYGLFTSLLFINNLHATQLEEIHSELGR